MTTIPAGLGIEIDPCGPEQISENFRQIVIQISRALPKRACALENWRTVGGIYPSHADYPSCPTLAQVPFVFVPADDGSGNVKVYLDCPTNRDPNIEEGDIVVYSEDADGNALYQGGHDDPIGTIKGWSDTATTPKGWRVLSGSAPAIETRTGKWPTDAENKYVANMPSHPLVVCPDHGVSVVVGVDVQIEDHDASEISIFVDPHPLTETSLEYTDIGITWNLETDYQYVEVDCSGDVNPDHAHRVEITGGSVNFWAHNSDPGGGASLFSAIGTLDSPKCTSEQRDANCNGEIDLTVDLDGCTTGYHAHDITGYIYLHDPGHFHAIPELTHNARAAGILSHDVTADAVAVAELDVKYLGVIQIIRYNNAANATPNTVLEPQQCGLL